LRCSCVPKLFKWCRRHPTGQAAALFRKIIEQCRTAGPRAPLDTSGDPKVFPYILVVRATSTASWEFCKLWHWLRVLRSLLRLLQRQQRLMLMQGLLVRLRRRLVLQGLLLLLGLAQLWLRHPEQTLGLHVFRRNTEIPGGDALTGRGGDRPVHGPRIHTKLANDVCTRSSNEAIYAPRSSNLCTTLTHNNTDTLDTCV
jgi:hypothetical protein